MTPRLQTWGREWLPLCDVSLRFFALGVRVEDEHGYLPKS